MGVSEGQGALHRKGGPERPWRVRINVGRPGCGAGTVPR